MAAHTDNGLGWADLPSGWASSNQSWGDVNGMEGALGGEITEGAHKSGDAELVVGIDDGAIEGHGQGVLCVRVDIWVGTVELDCDLAWWWWGRGVGAGLAGDPLHGLGWSHVPVAGGGEDESRGVVDCLQCAERWHIDGGADGGDGENVVGVGVGAVERDGELVVCASGTVEGNDCGVGSGSEGSSADQGQGGSDTAESREVHVDI
jgi:hypothetical protein